MKQKISISVLLLAIVITSALIIRNFVLYQNATGTIPTDLDQSVKQQTAFQRRQYTGVTIHYVFQETATQFAVSLFLENEGLALSGLDLTYIYDAEQLGTPTINDLNRQVNLPARGSTAYEADLSSYHVVSLNLLASQDHGINQPMHLLTLNFAKKDPAIVAYAATPVWLLTDTTLDTVFVPELADAANLIRKQELYSEAYLLNTNHFVRVDGYHDF